MVKIGLEVHVQLKTNSKLFCGCSAYWQGKEPNTNTCDYCLGFPGTKPRLNKSAIDYAIKIALALNCKLSREILFSRKSYFYPDMAKNFQITQYEIPLARDGYLRMGKKKIRISRINIEEDPARLVHPAGITGSDYVLVDYNRSGVPLCEIVTAPDFSSPKEARLFLQALASMLEYLGVFDSSMEASMRIDSNISLIEMRVEIKNITGFKDVEKALSYEIVRQRNLIRRGKAIMRETRGWDAATGITRSLRIKETEEDYGYIFEPDLTKIILSKNKIAKIKKSLPELAPAKIKRYVKDYKIHREVAESIADDPDLATMFEEVIKDKKINKKLAANWFADKLKKTLNYNELRIRDTKLRPRHIISLLKMIQRKDVTERTAEYALREIILKPEEPRKIIEEKEMTRIEDESKLKDIVDDVLAKNPRAVLDYKSGRSEVFNFLVGQVMRATKGRGDPGKIRDLLRRKL